MSLLHLIEPTVPIIKSSDTVDDVLRIMSETHLDKLPYVIKGNYITILKESVLLDLENPDSKISKNEIVPFRPFCLDTAHPYEAVRTALQYKIPVVPILNKQNEYLGSISRDVLFQYLGENSSMNDNGGILILEIKPGSFVLSQIAKILENENTIILNSRLYFNPQTDMLELTLKTNKLELQRVIAALERYDYVIKEVYGDIPIDNDVDDRYKLLMNYLNI